MTTDKPKRAWVLDLHVEGDSRADVIALLKSMLFDSLEPGSANSVSGGCSSGGYFTLTHNPDQTHDKFVGELETYLAARDGK